MNPNRFYSVPFDARNNTKILRLGVLQKNKMQAFGRWMALLGMLYDEHGVIDMADPATREVVASELCFSKPEQAVKFIEDCVSAGLLDASMWQIGCHVVSNGVADELAYRKDKSDAGRQGGKTSKRKQTVKQTDKQDDKQTVKQTDKQTDKQDAEQE